MDGGLRRVVGMLGAGLSLVLWCGVAGGATSGLDGGESGAVRGEVEAEGSAGTGARSIYEEPLGEVPGVPGVRGARGVEEGSEAGRGAGTGEGDDAGTEAGGDESARRSSPERAAGIGGEEPGEDGDGAAAPEGLPLGVGEGERGIGGLDGASVTDGLGVVRTAGAVLVVVVLIVGVRVVLGRLARASGGGIRGQLGAGGRSPSGVVQVLGRYPVARGQTLVLLKLDRRVLLLCQTSSGFSTLSEITEADDVASILSKARDDEGESLSARFGTLLRRLERDPETGQGEDVEIAPYLRRPSLDEVEGFGEEMGEGEGIGAEGGDAAEVLRRRLEGLRGLSA